MRPHCFYIVSWGTFPSQNATCCRAYIIQAINHLLRGRKALVVDDDARNIFALTTVLENHDMEVLSATNGRQAIEIIQNTPGLNVVLMDIMMPEMDGYETLRGIR